LASNYGYTAIVEVLLKNGANTELLAKWNTFDDKPAYTAKDFAKSQDIVDMFEKYENIPYQKDLEKIRRAFSMSYLVQPDLTTNNEVRALQEELEIERHKNEQCIKMVEQLLALLKSKDKVKC
jgi:hypothetical protein